MSADDPAVIRSASNPRFRALGALLARARVRREQGVSVIEGVHILRAYIERFGAPQEIFVSDADTPDAELATLLETIGRAPVRIAAGLFRQVSQVEHGHGPIAIVRTPSPTLPDRLDGDAIYLDRIQDPGNVGTILRTCAAVGLRTVISAPGTAFGWSPKVLRAGQGAHFHLDIHEGIEWADLRARAISRIRCTAADGHELIDTIDHRAPAIWVFGNEGEGVEPRIRNDGAVETVAIAQSRGVESLNVGVAAALALYAQWRARGYPGAGSR